MQRRQVPYKSGLYKAHQVGDVLSYDLEYENGMDYKQRQAFRSLGERKPDINKGRPFFSKLGAKIKSVWSKDYAALNDALERIQKDAKRNPQYYAEAIKESGYDGTIAIEFVAEKDKDLQQSLRDTLEYVKNLFR